MSYQVLARKYRPHRFTELVGQEHVSKALIHALENNRIHHAYLFSGTRGCGKTTIARILAKCLNCEEGVTATPCETCSSCREIAEGRFVDLIEVDAASRTRVEDTRELLDNVQYAPTRGRYKVYLIDEVHMLSTHSFNALLKTLEEPPAHVKFLFATTDPQKLPVTILSRCLQFNLTELSPSQISAHLVQLLGAEGIPFEEASLRYLGEAAKGSVRDALSLTDQAIAFSGGELTVASVTAMLGTVDRSHVTMLLRSLSEGEAEPLLQLLDKVLTHSPNETALLDETIRALHRLAVAQIVPQREEEPAMQDLAGAFTPEQLQLYYDIAVRSRRDFAAVPDGRIGLEMMLLRMLLFRPDGVLTSGEGSAEASPAPQTAPAGQAAPSTQVAPSANAAPTAAAAQVAPTVETPPTAPQNANQPAGVPPWQEEPAPVVAAPPLAAATTAPQKATEGKPNTNAAVEQAPAKQTEPQAPQATVAQPVPAAVETSPGQEPVEPPLQAAPATANSAVVLAAMPAADDAAALAQWWEQFVNSLALQGVVNTVARSCQLKGYAGDHWQLALHGGHQIMINREREGLLQNTIRKAMQRPITIEIQQDNAIDQSPDMIRAERLQAQLDAATKALQEDAVIQTLVQDFDAQLDLNSITPTAYE